MFIEFIIQGKKEQKNPNDGVQYIICRDVDP